MTTIVAEMKAVVKLHLRLLNLKALPSLVQFYHTQSLMPGVPVNEIPVGSQCPSGEQGHSGSGGSTPQILQ